MELDCLTSFVLLKRVTLTSLPSSPSRRMPFRRFWDRTAAENEGKKKRSSNGQMLKRFVRIFAREDLDGGRGAGSMIGRDRRDKCVMCMCE